MAEKGLTSNRAARSTRAPTSPRRTAGPETSPAPEDDPGASQALVRVRMYRVGSGECALLRFAARDRVAHVLVGCGAHPAGSTAALDRAVQDVVRECGGRLDAVVASREQADHVSGFASARDLFARLEIGEVWLPASLDPRHAAAAESWSRRRGLAMALGARLGAKPGGENLGAYLALNVAGGGPAIDALRGGLGTRAKVRYLGAGDALADAAGIAGLDVHGLAPSRDDARLDLATPIAPEAGARARGGLFASWELPRVDRALLSEKDEAHVRRLAAGDDERLAVSLDRACNAAGLALLLRFGGRALLFPGEAPWASWGWARRDATLACALTSLDFCRIGRQDAHGASRPRLIEALRADRTLAVVSAAAWPSPAVPSPRLAADLDARTRAWTRTDAAATVDASGSAVPPARGAKPPSDASFARGAMWIDCTLD